MGRKRNGDQPIGVGLTAKQMRRKKPVNSEYLVDIEPITENQKILFKILFKVILFRDQNRLRKGGDPFWGARAAWRLCPLLKNKKKPFKSLLKLIVFRNQNRLGKGRFCYE